MNARAILAKMELHALLNPVSSTTSIVAVQVVSKVSIVRVTSTNAGQVLVFKVEFALTWWPTTTAIVFPVLQVIWSISIILHSLLCDQEL